MRASLSQIVRSAGAGADNKPTARRTSACLPETDVNRLFHAFGDTARRMIATNRPAPVWVSQSRRL
jgi:hypothetical protein